MNIEKRDQLMALINTERIGGIMLDADGRIDRDFSILCSRLAPRAMIVIDDYADIDRYKHRSTKGLVDQLMEWGLLQPTELLDNTLFGVYPEDADPSRLDMARCQEIITETQIEFGREPTASSEKPIIDG